MVKEQNKGVFIKHQNDKRLEIFEFETIYNLKK